MRKRPRRCAANAVILSAEQSNNIKEPIFIAQAIQRVIESDSGSITAFCLEGAFETVSVGSTPQPTYCCGRVASYEWMSTACGGPDFWEDPPITDIAERFRCFEPHNRVRIP